MTKIIIVTINFNSEEETVKCLESLKKLNRNNFYLEVVVVDNGSEKEFILKKKKNGLSIHVIRLNTNKGFTGGNNAGIKFALEKNPDYIMLLNNDTLVDKNLMKEFLLFSEKNPLAGLIGPKIYFMKGHEFHIERYKKRDLGRILWYAGGGIDFANVMSFHRGVDEVDNGQYDEIEETGFVSGCCMFIKAQLLKEIGGFDERYFLYFEDADLNLKIKKSGYKIFYNPKAFLWHITSASSGGSGSSLHDYFLTRNRLIFGMAYAPFRSKIALFRESVRLIVGGREWQKKGVRDYFLRNFEKGSFPL